MNATPPDSTPLQSYWQRLFHRWFVEFNPLYLLSAALVLGGAQLLARGLADAQSPASALAPAAIAESYSLALIGGAALLVRIGLRRPAVMLALLAALYQWDPTLHVETSVYLGRIGTIAAGLWVVFAVTKVHLLARAMRVRLATRMKLALALGAVALAAGPRLLPLLSSRAAGSLLAVTAFAFASAYVPRAIESDDALDDWGRTVLRRTTTAVWMLATAGLAAHIAYWVSDREIQLASLVPIAPLILVRTVERERSTWTLVALAIALAVVVNPGALAVTVAVASVALAWRAIEGTTTARRMAHAAPFEPPYRATPHDEAPAAVTILRVVPLDRDERVRLATGALGLAYVAVWTHAWQGGPWPAHDLVTAVAFTVAAALLALRTRSRAPIVPPVVGAFQALIAARVVPPPRTRAEWGMVAVSLGFALLGGSVLVSYLMRRRHTARESLR